MIIEAFNAGKRAAKFGASKYDNPFTTYAERVMWLVGYDFGKQ